jgi:hypothetical protein
MTEQIATFVTAIHQAMKSIEEGMPNWGLDEEGEKTVRVFLSEIREATSRDLLNAQIFHLDIKEALDERLRLLDSLPETALAHLRYAKRATWLSDYRKNTAGEITYGLLEAINANKAGIDPLPN